MNLVLKNRNLTYRQRGLLLSLSSVILEGASKKAKLKSNELYPLKSKPVAFSKSCNCFTTYRKDNAGITDFVIFFFIFSYVSDTSLKLCIHSCAVM